MFQDEMFKFNIFDTNCHGIRKTHFATSELVLSVKVGKITVCQMNSVNITVKNYRENSQKSIL